MSGVVSAFFSFLHCFHYSLCVLSMVERDVIAIREREVRLAFRRFERNANEENRMMLRAAHVSHNLHMPNVAVWLRVDGTTPRQSPRVTEAVRIANLSRRGVLPPLSLSLIIAEGDRGVVVWELMVSMTVVVGELVGPHMPSMAVRNGEFFSILFVH